MSRSAHFAGVQALLTAPLVVHDSDAPLDAEGRVVRASYVVSFDLGFDELGDDRYTAAQLASSSVTFRVVERAVGVTPHAAREVRDAVASRLVGKVPTVTGRIVDPILLDDDGPVKLDTDVSPPLYFIDSDYTVRTHPA